MASASTTTRSRSSATTIRSSISCSPSSTPRRRSTPTGSTSAAVRRSPRCCGSSSLNQHHLSRDYDQIERRLEQLAAELPEGWRHFATRPLILLGEELQFRIGTKRNRHPHQRTVQIRTAAYNLTPFDDTAYVPQFAYAVRRDRDAVAAAIETRPTSLRLFDNGPTTDDMQCTARFEGDDLVLDVDVKIYPDVRPSVEVSPRHEQVAIRMPARAFVELLDRVLAVLV